MEDLEAVVEGHLFRQSVLKKINVKEEYSCWFHVHRANLQTFYFPKLC